jgi:hypothetical protein
VSVLSCVGAGGTLAYDRRVLAPVDRVEITIVIDNFLDVLMASEEGVARYQARDFGASEQLVAEHGFSALVAVERPRRRTSPSRPPCTTWRSPRPRIRVERGQQSPSVESLARIAAHLETQPDELPRRARQRVGR